jgi:DNA polymerase I
MTVRQRHQEPQYEALLAAGRTSWEPGERVRFYRNRAGSSVWHPEEEETSEASNMEEGMGEELDNLPSAPSGTVHMQSEVPTSRRDYDVEYYLQQLVGSYAARLRKAFEPEDYAQIFRLNGQVGLFDRPIEMIQPRWIRTGRET